MRYELTVVYPMRFYPILDRELETILGPSGSSGAGFGIRDCQWSYATEDDRALAEEKLDPLVNKYGEDLEISHGDIEDEDEEDDDS